MQKITITQPDDWHLHLRDGPALVYTVPPSARQFHRAIVMPNLAPPVTTVEQALAYRQRILAASGDSGFEPLMTLYLTDQTRPDEIFTAAGNAHVYGVKLYPAGATTNSASGVTNIGNVNAVLEAMAETGLPLLVHGEVTDSEVDIFDREAVFIDTILDPVSEHFPKLRIVLEHITTKEGVDWVISKGDQIAGTITPQHLLLNRNALFQGGIHPHHYCLPVLKREGHRQALVAAATSGSSKFFLGTDSAPHARSKKEADCGCAGIFSALSAIELYTEAFDVADSLDKLEAFASFNGADFYNLPRNQSSITLIKEEWSLPKYIPYIDNDTISPFRGGEPVLWKLQSA